MVKNKHFLFLISEKTNYFLKIKQILIFIGLLFLDQITKIIVNLTKPYIDLKIFAINFLQNTGAIWGIFKNSNLIFIWISLIAIGVLLYINDKIPEKAFYFYLMLLAGIIGNLIDRIYLGSVIDFIDFKFWPVFNFADLFIVTGVFGLIYFFMKE